MKKALVISLLTLLLVNTTGYYLLYALDYAAIRYEVAEMINKLSRSETVTLHIPAQHASEVTFTDENEIVYKGRMYDVISRTEGTGEIVYQCYSDNRETELNEHLDKQISSDSQQPVQKNKDSFKKQIKDFTSHQLSEFCLIRFTHIADEPMSIAYALLHFTHTVTHPPPELTLS